MAITKERKILMAAAGLACAVFVGDRVLMGGAMSGPQSADAAVGAVAAPAASPAAPAPVVVSLVANTGGEPSQSTAPVASLAERLEKTRGVLPHETRDVFRPSDYWQTPPDASVAAPQSPAFDAPAFAQRNPLDAVFTTGGQAQAVVAGQIVRPGETRDGLTLTQVGDRWVVWSGHGRQLKVHLDPKH